ncbi:egl-4, partial [Symbiodinium pilosum]
AVGAGKTAAVEQREKTEKTEDERELMRRALLSNESLNSMVVLDDQRVKDIIDVAWKEEVQEEQVVIK